MRDGRRTRRLVIGGWHGAAAQEGRGRISVGVGCEVDGGAVGSS